MLENPGFVHCRLELFLRDHGLMPGRERERAGGAEAKRSPGAVPAYTR